MPNKNAKPKGACVREDLYNICVQDVMWGRNLGNGVGWETVEGVQGRFVGEDYSESVRI
jgi:hypothetical protein